MPDQRALAGACYDIPQTDRSVTAARGDDLSVRRKGHGIDASTAKSLKQLVLTLLALLVQIRLRVPVTGHGHLWTGCTAAGTILISYSNTNHTQATTMTCDREGR